MINLKNNNYTYQGETADKDTMFKVKRKGVLHSRIDYSQTADFLELTEKARS